MAGDWIKVRVWISKDPKVIAIADYLAYSQEFIAWLASPGSLSIEECAYEVISRDITVMITVTSLVIIWGITRERGKRVDDDWVIVNAGLSTIDALCCVPSFGEAMASVGWLVEDEDEAGVPLLRFPNFLRHNAPYELRAQQHRAAQRAYRERLRARKGGDSGDHHGDHSGDITKITRDHSREEKRREEKEEENTSAHTEAAHDTRFGRFWSAYPRKTAKAAALKAWKKLRADDHLLAAMLAALERQSASDQWRSGIIPHPATWLNGRRWEDETSAQPQSGRIDPATFFGVDS